VKREEKREEREEGREEKKWGFIKEKKNRRK